MVREASCTAYISSVNQFTCPLTFATMKGTGVIIPVASFTGELCTILHHTLRMHLL
jgi:hypothetical protein